jgi:hypothetical protein
MYNFGTVGLPPYRSFGCFHMLCDNFADRQGARRIGDIVFLGSTISPSSINSPWIRLLIPSDIIFSRFQIGRALFSSSLYTREAVRCNSFVCCNGVFYCIMAALIRDGAGFIVVQNVRSDVVMTGQWATHVFRCIIQPSYQVFCLSTLNLQKAIFMNDHITTFPNNTTYDL